MHAHHDVTPHKAPRSPCLAFTILYTAKGSSNGWGRAGPGREVDQNRGKKYHDAFTSVYLALYRGPHLVVLLCEPCPHHMPRLVLRYKKEKNDTIA
ncbi:hypothetical protein XA68_10387 [Ophiocordyceps unilateralis]|uniref:Uncharacterized protein n=1 Tax=Ophiocordyceps unilateralis TaxID=268505 RepID=A0A2A9NZ02_OPHUN|nr:hypothetical protein XA68_10387 [Ophiocordyceps unilateralis]